MKSNIEELGRRLLAIDIEKVVLAAPSSVRHGSKNRTLFVDNTYFTSIQEVFYFSDEAFDDTVENIGKFHQTDPTFRSYTFFPLVRSIKQGMCWVFGDPAQHAYIVNKVVQDDEVLYIEILKLFHFSSDGYFSLIPMKFVFTFDIERVVMDEVALHPEELFLDLTYAEMKQVRRFIHEATRLAKKLRMVLTLEMMVLGLFCNRRRIVGFFETEEITIAEPYLDGLGLTVYNNKRITHVVKQLKELKREEIKNVV